MVLALCATSVAQAERINDPFLPAGADATSLIDQPSSTVPAEVPAESAGNTHIPEPAGLLLAGLAVCALSAIHLRRRWG